MKADNIIYNRTGWLMAVIWLMLSCNSRDSSDAITRNKIIDGIRYELKVMPYGSYKRSHDPGWQPQQDEADLLYVKMQLRHAGSDVDLVKWGCKDYEEYNRRLAFFNNEIRQHIYLSDGETLSYPLESVYENGYGISPGIDIAMVFRKTGSGENIRLVFEDEIFTKQIVKFSIK